MRTVVVDPELGALSSRVAMNDSSRAAVSCRTAVVRFPDGRHGSVRADGERCDSPKERAGSVRSLAASEKLDATIIAALGGARSRRPTDARLPWRWRSMAIFRTYLPSGVGIPAIPA